MLLSGIVWNFSYCRKVIYLHLGLMQVDLDKMVVLLVAGVVDVVLSILMSVSHLSEFDL